MVSDPRTVAVAVVATPDVVAVIGLPSSVVVADSLANCVVMAGPVMFLPSRVAVTASTPTTGAEKSVPILVAVRHVANRFGPQEWCQRDLVQMDLQKYSQYLVLFLSSHFLAVQRPRMILRLVASGKCDAAFPSLRPP